VPIHDQGYRRYAGRRTAIGGAWLVIARQHILPLLRQRRFLLVLLLAWVPFIVRAVQIYVASNYQQVSAFLGVTPQTFREFLAQQSLFVFLVSIALSGLIADDRRANALQLYLSKPLTRTEYIIGKLVTLVVFLLGITLLPTFLLLLLQILFAGSLAFVRANLYLIPAITLFSLLEALLSATVLLALSSLSNSRRFVSIMYAGAVFFTGAMSAALRNITGSTAWAWLSPASTLGVIGDAVFRIGNRSPDIPPWVAVVVVLALIVASAVVLERRVRGVEVVA
jgi:ABC-2 type transport system permease protein